MGTGTGSSGSAETTPPSASSVKRTRTGVNGDPSKRIRAGAISRGVALGPLLAADLGLNTTARQKVPDSTGLPALRAGVMPLGESAARMASEITRCELRVIAV